jgi:hypothetical protein
VPLFRTSLERKKAKVISLGGRIQDQDDPATWYIQVDRSPIAIRADAEIDVQEVTPHALMPMSDGFAYKGQVFNPTDRDAFHPRHVGDKQ